MPIVGSFAGASSRAYGFQSGLIGDFESIATTTLSSNQTTVTFDNIPQTYQHLQFRSTLTVNNTTQWITFTANDSGSGNYSFHEIRGDGGVAYSGGGGNENYGYLGLTIGTSPQGAVLDILDYTNTNKFKTFRSLYGTDANGGGYTGLVSTNWRSTNAITKIVFSITGAGSTINTNSRFALYGIKG